MWLMTSSENFSLSISFLGLVNRGNCYYTQGELEKAREYYQEALNIEASCTDALYNIGNYNLPFLKNSKKFFESEKYSG